VLPTPSHEDVGSYRNCPEGYQLDAIVFVFGLLSTNYLNLLVVVALEYRRLLSQTVFALVHDIIIVLKQKGAKKNEAGITIPNPT
jgi:hypothetical protein